eukprot:1155981-Pelagomonas_calceolata.AAC.7
MHLNKDNDIHLVTYTTVPIAYNLPHLAEDALGAGHDDCPLGVGSGHGCHKKALPPLLLDPLIWEGVRDLGANRKACPAAGCGASEEMRHMQPLLSGLRDCLYRNAGRTSGP